MTVQQIVNEARQLPREQMSELLAESFAHPDPEIDAAWREETQRRVAEIRSGQVQGIPGEQVMAECTKDKYQRITPPEVERALRAVVGSEKYTMRPWHSVRLPATRCKYQRRRWPRHREEPLSLPPSPNAPLLPA